uniref:Uncharacterized protein n=1 Tax=Cannabis sativa TaxID=3483 RepID=A0A803PBR3_CANSA
MGNLKNWDNRQGNPISPNLFLVCAKGLSTLIRHFEEKIWIHGYKVANGAHMVSHLLFADDNLYFKATKAPETTLHVLVRCDFAQSWWFASCVPAIAADAMTFAGWLEEGLQFWNKANFLGDAMICWAIWKLRNNLVWNSKQPVVIEMISLAKLNFVECCGVLDPSEFHTIKVNIYRALFSNERRFGVGLMDWTTAGLVLETKIMNKVGVLQPHVVEAIGIKEALS